MRHLVAAFALAVATLAAPAAADHAPHGFVLKGATSAWIDVKIPDDGAMLFRGGPIEGGKRYAGYLVEQYDTAKRQWIPKAGEIVLRGIGGEDTTVLLAFSQRGLDPGVARFHLFADGPATVHVDAQTPLRTLRPTRRVATRLSTHALARAGEALAADVPVRLPARPLVVAGVVAAGEHVTVASGVAYCVTAQPTCPAQTVPVVAGPDARSMAAWHGSALPPGPRYYARYRVGRPVAVRSATGVAFVAALAR